MNVVLRCQLYLPLRIANTTDLRVAALFWKRTLNDVRAIWNLLLLGYTSQAGSVAAAAFENALIVSCVAGNIGRAGKLLKSKTGDSPWRVIDLCKMHVKQQMQEEAKKSEKPFSEKDFELRWRELYSGYMWLCKVKHPTMASALHDAFSVCLENEFIIMAAPDVRAEDLPNKAMILATIVNHILGATHRFASACEIDRENARVISWQERLDSIVPDLEKAMEPLWDTPPPIQLGDSQLKREYLRLRQHASDE